MAYPETIWENTPSTNSPINADNLNKMEKGIYNNDADLSAYTGSERITMTSGALILTNSSPVSLTPSTNVNYSYAILNCSEGDKFKISALGSTSNTNAYSWSFINASNEILTHSALPNDISNAVITAPANATKLIINDRGNRVSYKGGAFLVDKVDDLENQTELFGAIIENPYNNAISLSNKLNSSKVFVFPTLAIPAKSNVSFKFYSKEAGTLSILLFEENSNGTYNNVRTISVSASIGDNIVSFTTNNNTVIGVYSTSNAICYQTNGTQVTAKQVDISDVSSATVFPSTSLTLAFSFSLSYVSPQQSGQFVIVDASGNGDYTSLLSAMQSEAENTVIIVRPGVYVQDMTACLKKRVVVIGTDRNQCIIKNPDGRYGHHALYVSCGYFENLSIIEPYISGTSEEIDTNTNGAYAVHIDTDDDYAVGKQIEFHHCNISSDFFPAVGAGLRKNMTLILDDCVLENKQIATRGKYVSDGTLGALYFHDSNGEQGDQYIIVKDCILKSSLGNTMTPYQVARETQNNLVHCNFINNVLYDAINKYSNNIWYRGDPFNITTGIFDIVIGFGNSNSNLNNN